MRKLTPLKLEEKVSLALWLARSKVLELQPLKAPQSLLVLQRQLVAETSYFVCIL